MKQNYLQSIQLWSKICLLTFVLHSNNVLKIIFTYKLFVYKSYIYSPPT